MDILLPKARLADAESALHAHRLDQRQPRRLRPALLPPLDARAAGDAPHLSAARPSTYHTILPPTSRLKPDAALLIEAAVPLPGLPGVSTLRCPT